MLRQWLSRLYFGPAKQSPTLCVLVSWIFMKSSSIVTCRVFKKAYSNDQPVQDSWVGLQLKRQGVAITGRNITGPPSRAVLPLVIYIAYGCDRCRQTTDDYRRQRPLLVWPATLYVGGPVIMDSAEKDALKYPESDSKRDAYNLYRWTASKHFISKKNKLGGCIAHCSNATRAMQ